MADSYPTADVGEVADFPRFPLEPNWASRPNTTIEAVKDLLEFRGTAHDLTGITDDAPIRFEAQFNAFTLANYNIILTFFVTARGMVNRFWVKHPYRSFKLKVNANNGDGVIYCYPNKFEDQYQGYERLYIEMSDGDIVARHVTAVDYNEGEDRVELQLNTILDRDVTTTNHVIIGRYLLVRFDSDDLKMKFFTDQTSEFGLSFYELVKEYSEI